MLILFYMGYKLELIIKEPLIKSKILEATL